MRSKTISLYKDMLNDYARCSKPNARHDTCTGHTIFSKVPRLRNVIQTTSLFPVRRKDSQTQEIKTTHYVWTIIPSTTCSREIICMVLRNLLDRTPALLLSVVEKRYVYITEGFS